MISARDRILGRLKAGPVQALPERPDWTPPRYGEARVARFRAMLEASHADVHSVSASDWPARLKVILANKGVRTLLVAPGLLDWDQDGAPQRIGYDRDVEQMKDLLVGGIDAALTTAKGGIAQTGSLILWPDAEQPRLMSLLPPIHVALINEETIADSLADVLAAEGWAERMPTNALLISGPSKTADIEQTLAYGVHGPKELIVLIIGRDREQA
jgi:L-lactate dehydrogenase complex protein LldG